MTDSDSAVRERAEALLDLGRAGEAETYLRQALSSQPGDPGLLVLLSRAVLRLGRFAEARDHAAAALAANPQDANALSFLAAALSGLKEHDAALATVWRARSLAPMSAVLHRQEAEICLAANRAGDALAAARRARGLAPSDARNAAAVAAASLADNRFADAAEAAREALRLDPENARAHRIIGLLGLRAGDGAESIARYRDALRLDPTDERARLGLAIALKSRNPVYRRVLQFEFWASDRPPRQLWAIRLAPFAAARIAALGWGQIWSYVLLGLVGVFVFAVWTTDPVMNLMLMANRSDRQVLTTGARRSALVFAGFASGAVACFVALPVTGARGLVPLGFGLAIWGVVAGSSGTTAENRWRLFTVVTAVAALFAVAGVVATALGAGAAASALGVVLLVGGIAAFWIVALRG
ncbi:MAG TPA: tetratricopeptide repeat protein [Mycobacteriales bacterium]|nr:tetratricopeptide repeat protein [Mycobacteriales bacterium]